MKIDSLIGMEFKRNVYGPSLWTDVVKNIWIRWKILDREGKIQIPEIMVEGSKHQFPLSEIIFIRELDRVQLFNRYIEEKRARYIKAFLDGKTGQNTEGNS